MSDTASPISRTHISARRFLLAEQIKFANFSGDANPIHMDPIDARRTISGQCIVHGMHGLLWALDSFAKERNIAAIEMEVAFRRPIFLDEDIRCIWDERRNLLSLLSGDLALTEIRLTQGAIVASNAVKAEIQASRSMPQAPTFKECSGFSRRPFRIHGDMALAKELFPFCCDLYGVEATCEMAAISQIVGMECPGLHSLFASLKVKIGSNQDTTSTFSVILSDERHSLLRILVEGYAVIGEVEAFYRPPPASNLSISELSAHVESKEFENVCALIVGGSRGLGELVAKLIAAGGGKSIVTYNVGKLEAEKLLAEIHSWGTHCEAIQLTVNGSTSLPPDIPIFNHFYYFATPKIFGRRPATFDSRLLQQFSEIYVKGFEGICRSIIARRNSCAVLYPSTVAIEEPVPGLMEYAASKAEGERLCRVLNVDQFLNILTPRLPRLATDQTNSLVRIASANSVEILLGLIREMSATA